MGAILGRIALDGRDHAGPAFRDSFARALSALRPGRVLRSDMLVQGACGYGHHDLGLGPMPPDAPTQPLVDGGRVLLADATLYARDDLARALGVRAGSHSDADLILRAWRRWGPGCLAYLNGDFGLAIHDPARREVFLARDHIGARPLHWARRGGEVLFATHAVGLQAFDDLDWPVNEARIARYLTSPREIRLEGFLDHVMAVAPGEWVRITPDSVERQLWWDPHAIPLRPAASSQDAQDGLRAATEAAVIDRLPATASVGAHFSGGLDSTLVTVLSARQLQAAGRNLAAAYTWSPPMGDAYPDMGAGDERAIIAARCAELGIPVRYGAATPAQYESLIARPTELEGTTDLMGELRILDDARSDGISVMLSGWGGDEGLSTHAMGYPAWLLQRGQLRRALGVARRLGGGLRHPRRVARIFWLSALVPLLPDSLYRWVQPFNDTHAGGAFPSAAMKTRDTLPASPESLRLIGDPDRFMRLLLAQGHIAERMTSWAAWGADQGLVYRYPLTDRRVLEHMLSLPPDQRFGTGAPRYLANRAFADLLPRGLKKHDPANEKLRADNRRAWLEQLRQDDLQGRFDTPCPWLDMQALRAAVQAEPTDNTLHEVQRFARLFVALRVLAVHARAQRPANP